MTLPGNRRRGQAMVEFLIVVPVLLILVLGALQFALVYRAKTTLQYAAFETARAGALNNARLWAMEHAFARSMAPLYTNIFRASGSGSKCASNYDRLTIDPTQGFVVNPSAPSRGRDPNFDHAWLARECVKEKMDLGRSRILLINPTENLYSDSNGFGVVDPAVGNFIPNDNLMWRSSVRRHGVSIQDANLIKVHVAFCYDLVVPLVNRIMQAMMSTGVGSGVGGPLPTQRFARQQPGNFGPLPDGFGKQCAGDSANPRIPIYAHSLMRMHSEAILDANSGYPLLASFRCAGGSGDVGCK